MNPFKYCEITAVYALFFFCKNRFLPWPLCQWLQPIHTHKHQALLAWPIQKLDPTVTTMPNTTFRYLLNYIDQIFSRLKNSLIYKSASLVVSVREKTFKFPNVYCYGIFQLPYEILSWLKSFFYQILKCSYWLLLIAGH